MKNQIILAGILLNNPIIQKTKNGKEFIVLEIEVKREITSNIVDIFKCISMNTSIMSNCKIGDLIEIKGKLYSENSRINNRTHFAIIVTNIKILN